MYAAPGSLFATILPADVMSRASVFLGNLLTDVVNDRTRLIQVSLIIVVLGIAMLWWRK